MVTGIYKIVNPKGRIYVGLSTDIEKRWKHYNYLCNVKSQILLYRSFAKYGIENHIFEIVEILKNDLTLLSDREIYWINYFKSYYKHKGLNLTKGGNFPNKQTGPMSEEQKRKIGLSNTGKKHSEKTKDLIRNKRKEQIISKEDYKKASISRQKPCVLLNKITGQVWKADSLKMLVNICPISCAAIYKIRNKETKKYKFNYE